MLPDGKGLKLTDAQIAGITAPSLALIGADDPARPGVEALQKLHPQTRVVVIAHSDHMNAWQKPEFLLELMKFLEAHRAGK
jgi:pimeloyl-ACP methyl ester carboxylesterase